MNRYDESAIQVYRESSCDVVRFPRSAEFELHRDRITCTLLRSEYEEMVDVWFLGQILAYYLELHGALAIHAAAVNIEGRAALFVGDAGDGKSTLTASLLAAGLPLIADDVAVVEHRDGQTRCRSSYPHLKLTPEQTRRFLGAVGDCV